MHNSLIFIRMLKPPPNRIIYYWWPGEHRPQTYWSLRIDNANPCDLAWLPHHQPIRACCTSWSSTLTWSLQVLGWNPLGSWRCLSTSCLRFLVWPYNKHWTFIHHNLVSVDWLYCTWVSGPKFGLVTGYSERCQLQRVLAKGEWFFDQIRHIWFNLKT